MVRWHEARVRWYKASALSRGLKPCATDRKVSDPRSGFAQYIAYATTTPVPGSAMYCLPPTMYVIGVACVLCATFTFHTALPVLASSTSSPPPPPMNSSPPAVDSTPDRPAGDG